MKHIFKVIFRHSLGILITLILLAIQAWADLKLPEVTSDIINVGIQQQGITSNVPNKVSQETFIMLNSIMNDELVNYYKLENEYYVLLDNVDTALFEYELAKAQVTLMMLKNIPSISEYLAPYSIGSIINNPEMDALFTKIDEMDKELLMQTSINTVIEEYKSIDYDLDSIQMDYLYSASFKMLGLSLLIVVDLILSCYSSGIVAARIAKELRSDVVKRVMDYSNAEFNSFSTSSLITRSTNDVTQVQNFITTLLRMILYAPIVGTMAVIKVIHIDMAWVIGIAIAIIIIVIIILLKVGLPKFKIIQKLIDKLNLVVRESLNGLPVIRAFANEKFEKEKFNKANTDLYKNNLFINKLMCSLSPIMTLVMNGTIVLVYWVGANKISAGSIQVGTLTALVTYTIHIIISFLILSMVSIMAPRAIVALKRIAEIFDKESSIKDEGKKNLNKAKGLVKFNHVSFKYPDGDENVLTNLDFTINPGSTTAIIGSTGCGKSTVINLLPRFFDVTEGSITIDDIDIRDIKLESLRDNVGLVPQKGSLFAGTIKSNIKFSNSKMSNEDMELAAKIACCDKFINKFDEKYDYQISQGGTNVSGGQRQRLCIARAVAKKPSIIIFDDSFSALDYQTDLMVRKNLNKYLKDTTKIIVAQRVGTIRNADQIIVLEDGHIVGIGTHEELFKNCEVYKQIALSQLREEECL